MKPVTAIRFKGMLDALLIRPLDDKVLVRLDDAPDKVGSIYLPDQSKKPAARGTVVAVGPGKMNMKDGSRRPVELKTGDVVYVPKWGGDRLEDEEKTLLIYREEEILAVVEEKT
jgi:chaperonin GroES